MPSENEKEFYVIASGAWDADIPRILNTLRETFQKRDFGSISAFEIPYLCVGTLDTMLLLSEELCKLDSNISRILQNIATGYKSAKERRASPDKHDRKSKPVVLSVNGHSQSDYIVNFKWDTVRYNTSEQLPVFIKRISDETNDIENIIKTNTAKYEETVSKLDQVKRKYTGDLSVRSLNDIVKPEHIVLNSEYMVSMLVAVRCSDSNNWMSKYQTLCDMVVPNSCFLVHTDGDYNLYSVTIFKNKRNEFVENAAKNKFIVRQFEFDPRAYIADKKLMSDLSDTEKGQSNSLIRLLESGFGELMTFYVHTKIMIVFVESVLRHGPRISSQKFEPVLVKAKNEKSLNKIKSALESQFSGTSAEPEKYYNIQRELLSKEGIVINMSEAESSIISFSTLETFV